MLSQTWRSSFYMLAGVNVLCLIGGLLSIDEDAPHPKDDKKVDWIGASLITIALVMILFVLGDGESAPKRWATGCKCHCRIFVCYSRSNLITGALDRYYRTLGRWCIFSRSVHILAMVLGESSR